ncbi:hypothetical protein LX36DRAFT_196414 [Colletotrichum falcatum]|nr:hypothetical protein LX36DRAFT_196414 [Colletotrichum falcatum]
MIAVRGLATCTASVHRHGGVVFCGRGEVPGNSWNPPVSLIRLQQSGNPGRVHEWNLEPSSKNFSVGIAPDESPSTRRPRHRAHIKPVLCFFLLLGRGGAVERVTDGPRALDDVGRVKRKLWIAASRIMASGGGSDPSLDCQSPTSKLDEQGTETLEVVPEWTPGTRSLSYRWGAHRQKLTATTPMTMSQGKKEIWAMAIGPPTLIGHRKAA